MTKMGTAGVLLASFLLALVGCATGPRYTWTNPSLSNEGISPQQFDSIFKSHQLECQYRAQQLAEQLYPEPRAPQQTQISGRVDGRSFTATAVTPAPNLMYYNAYDAVLEGQRKGQKSDAVRQYFAGCLSEKGWQQTLVPPKQR